MFNLAGFSCRMPFLTQPQRDLSPLPGSNWGAFACYANVQNTTLQYTIPVEHLETPSDLMVFF